MISLVSFISADGGDAIKIVAEREGEKRTLTVSADEFLSLGLVKGEVCEYDFIEIERAALYYRAYRTALRMLESGQCSKNRLYSKLRSRSFSHEAAQRAVDRVSDAGYIDEEGQLESYLRILIEKKHCGRRKIVPYLLTRGYSSSKINAALSAYDEGDFARAKSEFLLKKFGKTAPSSADEAAEMKKALYKQGF